MSASSTGAADQKARDGGGERDGRVGNEEAD